MMYRTYLFDLYGTLVDIHTNEEKGYLWEKMAMYMQFQGARFTPSEDSDRIERRGMR